MKPIAVLVVAGSILLAVGSGEQSLLSWWNGLSPESAARAFSEDPANSQILPPHSVLGFYLDWMSDSEATVILHAYSSALGRSSAWAYAIFYVGRQGNGPWTVRRVIQPLTDWYSHRFPENASLKSAWATAPSAPCEASSPGINLLNTRTPPELTGRFAVCLAIDMPARSAQSQPFIVVGRLGAADRDTTLASDAALLSAIAGVRAVRLSFPALAAGAYRIVITPSGAKPLAELAVVVKK